MSDKRIDIRAARKAKQEFKNSCDITAVVSAYKRGQSVSVLRQPLQGDFTKVPDIRDVVKAGDKLRQAFMSHPATVRDRFGNDPGKMVAFVRDPKNKDEALKLGLIVAPKPPPPPVKVEVINSVPPKEGK